MSRTITTILFDLDHTLYEPATGLLHAGDRIQMLSANATYCPGLQVTKMSLKAFCHRTIAGSVNYVSG